MAPGETALSEGWEWQRSTADAAASPAELPANGWRPAIVPGTAAQSMKACGLWNERDPAPLDDEDIWYRLHFAGTGSDRLRLGGLATIGEVWLNGHLVLTSDNMFLAHRLDLKTRAENDLHLCFRSLSRLLAGKRGRARWRPRMISPPGLRFVRTTLLGHMPGWCPSVHAVGPWRPITLQPIGTAPQVLTLDLRPGIQDGDGVVTLCVTLDRDVDAPAWLCVGGASARLHPDQARTLAGQLRIPAPHCWWPHTHGDPFLYPASLMIGDDEQTLAPIGFRTLMLDRGEDGRGFTLLVNDRRVFCRGACWTSPDIVSLPGDRDSYAPLLSAAQDAGMNMIRLGGTMLYESDAFYELCDELGVMVWQDFMLSNFDYPVKDESFRASLTAEVDQFLCRTQPRACIAILCGGSEVMQQAAMLGLPRAVWEEGPHSGLVPDRCAALRPDVPYVSNSPSGGDWPFLPNEGVTHYYGVGAYLLPVADARRAGVRFTSECLGFANVPCARTVEQTLPVSSTTDPRWKAATPHDIGVAWDFEDIRDHYLRELFGVDPIQLRYEDFERYLDASRAVGCVVMEAVFAEWRRVGSICAGGIVWQLRDLRPGAGWGVIDSLGRPKPAWHALQRAFRPRQLVITDEGLNGLHLHILNESPEPLRAQLMLVCLRDGRVPIRQAERDVELAPHGAAMLPSTALIPEFFDIAYAYRFGPPFHSVTAAWLTHAGGALIADAYHFPRRILPAREELGLTAAVTQDSDGWSLCLRTDAFAQFVHVEDPHFRAKPDWFHLPPGIERRTRLIPFGTTAAAPDGEVRALNLAGAVSFRSRP